MSKTIMTVAAALLAAAPLATAAVNGSAHVINHCTDTVTLWSVGDTVAGPYTLETGGYYNETYSSRSGGKYITIGKSADTLYASKSQTVLSYTLNNASKVFYSLEDLYGDAFSGSTVLLEATDVSCPTVQWTDGTPPAGNTTTDNACTTDADIKLTLCA